MDLDRIGAPKGCQTHITLITLKKSQCACKLKNSNSAYIRSQFQRFKFNQVINIKTIGKLNNSSSIIQKGHTILSKIKLQWYTEDAYQTCASLILRTTSRSKGFFFVIYSCRIKLVARKFSWFFIFLCIVMPIFCISNCFFTAFLLFVYSLVTNCRQLTIRLQRHEMTDFIRYIP